MSSSKSCIKCPNCNQDTLTQYQNQINLAGQAIAEFVLNLVYAVILYFLIKFYKDDKGALLFIIWFIFCFRSFIGLMGYIYRTIKAYWYRE